MKHTTLILALTLALISCKKPQIATAPPLSEVSELRSLKITGLYNLQTCKTFVDARITDSGLLLHDDTTEAQNCQDETSPFHLQTFLFPVGAESPDSGHLEIYRGLRIESRYPLTTENFQLSTPHYSNFQQQAKHLYIFATPGKYILQVFFPESNWQTFVASAYKLDFSFQVTDVGPWPQWPNPKFTLLQGTYDPQTQTVHLEPVGPRSPDQSPEFQFQLINSLNTIHIRSIYTLLTEDFSLWQEDTNCQSLQNWDLSLTSAIGYHQLEVKLDPPFLECVLERNEEVLRFRVALLR